VPPREVDDPANLLVARPDEAERAGDEAKAAVGLGDGDRTVVEALHRGDEPAVDSGRERQPSPAREPVLGRER
jgi:hypothetical protein